MPAVVSLFQREFKPHWAQVVNTMRRILPALQSIKVDYTTSRTLTIFFQEREGRPWTVNEVSDGTVQTLALLLAIFDPRSSSLVIEEPENSVHPWIVRNILKACREVMNRKQILITTHSPVVINSVKPDDIWVIWKAEGESKMAPLLSIDPTVKRYGIRAG